MERRLWLSPESAETLSGLFAARVARTPHAIAYQYYDDAADCWRSLSWADMDERIARWRAALAGEGLTRGDRVAILLRNGPEWVAVDQAALGLGLVVVALYPDETPARNAILLEDAGARAMVVESARQWQAIAARQALPELTCVVALDEPDGADDSRLHGLADWLPAQGDGGRRQAAAGEDLASLIYTSGTTGHARGAMLSHANLLWNAHACARAVPVPDDEQLLSLLPLAHAFERTVGYYRAVITGATTAFARQSRFIDRDLRQVRPTVIVAVPRFYERHYSALCQHWARQPRLLQRLSRATVSLGWSLFLCRQGRGPRRTAHLLWPVLRRLVADPCLAGFGGRLQIAITGAAALPPPVARTLLGLGLTLLQGYGLTEAGPVVSVNSPADNDPDSVGTLLEGVESRVGKSNELWVRSPGVMHGYWGDEQATASVFDAGGWLRTGDKVSRLDKRRLYLTGRVKEVIVMTTGDKASPEPLERVLAIDPLVSRAVVVGEARPYLAAVVTCDEAVLKAELRALSLDPHAPASLRSGRFERHVLKRFARLLHDSPGHAQIRRLLLTTEAWTVDNGLLTATGKVRRRQVARRYRESIERLYGRRSVPEKTDFSYNVNVG